MPLKRSKIFAKTLFLSNLCMLALMVTAIADASVQVDSTSVNFGQVKQGETVSAKFQITNAGTKPLTIQFMEFSTPGMRAQVQPRIDAGSSTEILVTWNTSGLSGEVKGETKLTFNDPKKPEIVLTITATVVP